MSYTVSILSEAELEIDNAFIWFELVQVGLGEIFLKTVNKSIKHISNRPFKSTKIENVGRGFIMKKSPFGIYYKVSREEKLVQVLGVIYCQTSSRFVTSRFHF
jgi:toxin ParE1/3/4